jgi:hypothetical protein
VQTALKKPQLTRNRLRSSTHRRVLVHGLPYFSQMFAEIMSGDGWEFCFYPDEGLFNLTALAWQLRGCDIAYQIGGRATLGKFLWAAKYLNKTNMVMHWAGSDTLDERGFVALGRTDPWVKNDIHHWAESDWMVREVQDLGLRCEQVPLPSSKIPDRATALPAEFSVLVHMPAVEFGMLYGLDRILHVARSMPHIPFRLVGLKSGRILGAPENLQIHERVKDLSAFYNAATVVWRPVRHDGLSFMVREALGYGRYVLYTYPFPGCVQVQSAEDAQREIQRLFELHESGELKINQTGESLVTQLYSTKHLRQQILSRLENLL